MGRQEKETASRPCTNLPVSAPRFRHVLSEILRARSRHTLSGILRASRSHGDSRPRERDGEGIGPDGFEIYGQKPRKRETKAYCRLSGLTAFRYCAHLIGPTVYTVVRRGKTPVGGRPEPRYTGPSRKDAHNIELSVLAVHQKRRSQSHRQIDVRRAAQRRQMGGGESTRRRLDGATLAVR